MTKKLTPAQRRALEILGGIKNPSKGMKAKAFGWAFYRGTQYEYLLGTRKAWLCAGSYLAKLCKTGLVKQVYDRNDGFSYAISDKGEKALKKSM